MKTMLASTALTLSLLAVALWVLPAGAQNGKPPTAKELMQKLNKGPNSLCPTIGKELKAENPSWEQVQKDAKEFVTLATALAAAKPPKDEDNTWDKHAKAYAADARALESAVDKKDKAAAQKAHAKLANMKTCNDCHGLHR